ncbi:outer membrane protein W [Yersinia frederiksenii]|uniref:Outer membrane protein W n=2 Tax=Yersinia frederiksenii TaxID=29484 RepID=A0A380PPU2_YERFR|nr:outer membrane protein OmpW [Yersinia frederiksenii]ATM95767.1 outer membrane protein OmpW [Yersinia frederiksenii]KGA44513.1 oprF membrane domain protein [Yersinia frederiksenii ATCC 33641]MDN0117732.1 outer membrane protein OmpW [Yersinia frederiksenii]CFR08496.1 outer membrane protein W [Yersinia frederiksenii]CNF92521.1 outer membrane protein W [Yersinia frederiksenii]
MKKVTLALLAVATLASTAVSAHQAGDYIFRAGTATVRPNAGSDDVLGYGSFKADNNTQLGLTFSYLITDNIGVELLAATPFRHKIGLEPTGNIAEVKQLPPTLMAQYYFRDKQDKLRPYLGIGLNYTTFFDEKFNNTGSSAGLTDLSVKDSWGVAGQAGLDYMVSENWMLNMSVWWMNIETDVKFKAGGEEQTIHTRLDPWVFMFGAGYRF